MFVRNAGFLLDFGFLLLLWISQLYVNFVISGKFKFENHTAHS